MGRFQRERSSLGMLPHFHSVTECHTVCLIQQFLFPLTQTPSPPSPPDPDPQPPSIFNAFDPCCLRTQASTLPDPSPQDLTHDPPRDAAGAPSICPKYVVGIFYREAPNEKLSVSLGSNFVYLEHKGVGAGTEFTIPVEFSSSSYS